MTLLTVRVACKLGGDMHREDKRNGQEVVGKMWDCCGIRVPEVLANGQRNL